MNEDHAETSTSSMGPPLMVLVHTMAWAPFLTYLMVMVPRSKKVFMDLQVKLPWVVEVVLGWSDWLASIGPTWLVGLLVFLGLDLAVLYNLHLTGRRGLAWLWFVFFLVLPLACWLVSWFFIWAKMSDVMEALSR